MMRELRLLQHEVKTEGNNMSIKTKAKAKAIAEKVAAQLGKPWTPVVWENLGWHACVQVNGGYLDGGMTLYIHISGFSRATYSVMGINRTLGDGGTPLAAVRKAHVALEKMQAEATECMIPLFAAMRRDANAKADKRRKR